MTSPSKKSSRAAKLQFTSNFTREPGGRYQSSVRNNNTGETKTIDSRKGKEVSSQITFSKNPDTVTTTDGETLSWEDWARSRGWESGNHATSTAKEHTASTTHGVTTKKDGEGETQARRQKIRDPLVDPATVGFDASQL